MARVAGASHAFFLLSWLPSAPCYLFVHLQDTAERHALEEHSKLLAALLRGMTLQEQEQHAQQVTQAAAQRQQQQQRSTAPAAAATAAEEAVNREQRQQQIMDVTEELDNDFDYEDVADLAGSDSDFDADQVSLLCPLHSYLCCLTAATSAGPAAAWQRLDED